MPPFIEFSVAAERQSSAVVPDRHALMSCVLFIHPFIHPLRRLPAWRLLRTIRLDDETALPLGWQWNPRLINRGGDQRFHVGMCQLAGRLNLDETSLLSRSPQKPLRVGQLRSLIEVQGHTGGTCAYRHDGIDPSVHRRVADD